MDKKNLLLCSILTMLFFPSEAFTQVVKFHPNHTFSNQTAYVINPETGTSFVLVRDTVTMKVDTLCSTDYSIKSAFVKDTLIGLLLSGNGFTYLMQVKNNDFKYNRRVIHFDRPTSYMGISPSWRETKWVSDIVLTKINEVQVTVTDRPDLSKPEYLIITTYYVQYEIDGTINVFLKIDNKLELTYTRKELMKSANEPKN